MPTISGTIYDHTGAAAAGRIVRAYRRDTGALLGAAVTSDGLPIAGDPHYANVSLLLHMDGGDYSTTFTDSSPSPKTVTATGDAKVSTAQSKWGGASAYFDGSGAYVDASGGVEYDLGVVSAATQFTAEMFVRPDSTPATLQYLLAHCVPGSGSNAGRGGWGIWAVGGKLRLWISDVSNAISPWVFGLETNAVVLQAGVWAHVALVIKDGIPAFYVNGSAVPSTATTGPIWKSSPIGLNTTKTTYGLRVGSNQIDANNPAPSQFFHGYIDDLRITKGVARYTANFTPPAAPHYDRLLADATPAGSYSITTAYTGEVQRIVLDDDAGTLYNDLIDRVIVA